MSATSRELVSQALERRGPARAPRQLWALPWAQIHHGEELAQIIAQFPSDIGGVSGHERESAPTQGDPYRQGTYVDPWGCVFENIQDGVIGEVHQPLIEEWQSDVAKVRFPREWLTLDRDAINRDCAASEQFLMAGTCPRPFEQLQFMRGSQNLYFDLADPPREMLDLLRRIHEFYCEVLTAWAQTDVDALMWMDDWGSQNALLINPTLWRELFKPLYRDYVQIAHGAGKKPLCTPMATHWRFIPT
jgi:uroporphyrinogen decarboxylase